jgi:hypothetical protein
MAERAFGSPCHPSYSNQERNMTPDTTYQRTAILVASLFLVTTFGAVAGSLLMDPIIRAPDYLSTVLPHTATVTSGMLFWLINDIGIVFIGLLMYPILRRQSESLALAYVSMRICECLFMMQKDSIPR